MEFTSDTIRDYLRDNMRLDSASISEDDILFSNGRIDSFEMAGLIVFIEEQTGLRLGPADITVENFDSIGRMVSMVATRQQAMAS